MTRALALCTLVFAAACGDGLSVDFHLHTVAGSGPVTALSVAVSGDETYDTMLPASAFHDAEATLRYVPKVGVGAHLTFTFQVVADTTFVVVRDVVLTSGHNATDVVLDPAGSPDDLGAVDGAVDLAPMPCTSSAACSGTTPICDGTHCVACGSPTDCTTKDPTLKYCDPDGSCLVCKPMSGVCQSSSMLLSCNADGTVESPSTCAGNDCNGCTGACGLNYCEGKNVTSCDETGTASKQTVKTCNWTCDNGGCLALIPTHFDSGSFTGAGTIMDLSTGGQTILIDTKTNLNAPTIKIGNGAVNPWGAYSNGADPNNVTFVVGKLTIGAGDTLRVVGSRNILFAANGDVAIDGTLDASGHISGTFVGPGPGASTTVPGNTAYTVAGRGGGGHATSGAAGGSGNAGAVGGVAGVAALGDANIAGTFMAGTRGPTSGYGSDGVGGGAVQITSLGTITVSAAGKVLAGGGGGGGGEVDGNNWPGIGGGAGGSILLEARTISVLGVVAANGGSGGGIDLAGSPINGVDGQASKVPAAPPAGANLCAGGKGGAAQIAPTVGGNGVASGQYGCGGGGSYGRILFRVLGALPTYPTATISPDGSDAFTINNLMSTPSGT